MPASSADADRKVGGYYSPAELDLLEKDRSLQIYEGSGFTAVEHRIISKFDLYLWKIVEYWYEDGTHVEILGADGSLFSENFAGPYIGYHSGNDAASVFMIDASDLSSNYEGKTYSQIKYDFILFRVTEESMKSYDCTFRTQNFKNKADISWAESNYPTGTGYKRYDFLKRITKFLSGRDIDPADYRCTENPKYLGDGARAYKADVE